MKACFGIMLVLCLLASAGDSYQLGSRASKSSSTTRLSRARLNSRKLPVDAESPLDRRGFVGSAITLASALLPIRVSAKTGDPWSTRWEQTSPILEKLRMFEQVSSDVTTYDKELADPTDKTTNQSTKNLVPVLKLIDALEEIAEGAIAAKTDAEVEGVKEKIMKVTEALPSKKKSRSDDVLNVPGLKVRWTGRQCRRY